MRELSVYNFLNLNIDAQSGNIISLSFPATKWKEYLNTVVAFQFFYLLICQYPYVKKIPGVFYKFAAAVITSCVLNLQSVFHTLSGLAKYL